MKKRVRFFPVLILIFLTLAGIFALGKTLKADSYGDWGRKTKAILSENFNGFLPEVAVAQNYGQNYYYKYKQAPLGDANFVIYIEIALPDDAAFNNFLAGYEIDSIESRSMSNETVYFIQGDAESIAEYLDDEIYDGMYYNFELISVDKNSLTVEFLSAQVWDYYKDDFLCNHLRILESAR
ncbi:MAG: hypothetical protein J6J62_02245 [Oscillospiraceae bacterium]|nr:hypothetical protein [Oscillospiraceae bacterium]